MPTSATEGNEVHPNNEDEDGSEDGDSGAGKDCANCMCMDNIKYNMPVSL